MRPHGSPEELQHRRERAIGLLKGGYAPVDVAQMVGVDRRSVRRWKAAFRQSGKRGIAARPAPGRPSKLTAEAKARLTGDLLQGARAAGFPTDLWTCPRVAKLIRRRYGVRYHVDHIGRLLRSMGFSPQRPTRRAAERDEGRVQAWVKRDWPRIRKKGRD